LQGASLDYAKLQGANLVKAELQGAVLYNTELQGVDWSQANLEGIFILDGLAPEWNEHQQQKLEILLKPLMDVEKFSAFQSRMKNAGTGIPQDKLTSRSGCYSENLTLLDCEYRRQQQLDAYRSEVLYPKLTELACSDVAIATGIARRGSDESTNNDPNFGLAAALAKVLNSPKPCEGLAALTEKTREKLLKTAEHQKKEAK
jgi:Pentapeptide repeats (8 copies)